MLPITDELTLDTNNAESSFNFDFPTIKAATDNFSIANKLGQGGFGAVYKVILFLLQFLLSFPTV